MSSSLWAVALAAFTAFPALAAEVAEHAEQARNRRRLDPAVRWSDDLRVERHGRGEGHERRACPGRSGHRGAGDDHTLQLLHAALRVPPPLWRCRHRAGSTGVEVHQLAGGRAKDRGASRCRGLGAERMEHLARCRWNRSVAPLAGGLRARWIVSLVRNIKAHRE